MQHQPLQTPLRSDTTEKGNYDGGGGDGGGGPHKSLEKEWFVVREGKKRVSTCAEEESTVIKLGLGSREQENNHPLIKYKKKPVVLSPAQLFEFQLQALIFKYMRAGLPVPLQLLAPVWKNVASSFGSDSGGIYKQYPSFVGFSSQEFDFKNMMEPEPGRCRRTDGKKWRCTRNVVPDQKYCERHMHRGRQRSRKLVEACQIASPSCNTSAKVTENFQIIPSYNPHPKSAQPFPLTPPSDLKNSRTISTIFQFMTPTSNTTSSHDITTSSTGSISDNKADVLFLGISNSKSFIGSSVDSGANTTTCITNLSTTTTTTSIPACNDSKNDVSGSKKSILTITIAPDTVVANTSTLTNNPIALNSPGRGTSITTTKTATAAAGNYLSSINGKPDSTNCIGTKDLINISRKKISNTNTSSNPSAGLDFSPKSVLQVLGCSSIELEPGRCRRTDGKKWRCSREVVPDQKYCGRHMHRGAKKRGEASQPVDTSFTRSACRSSSSTMTVSTIADSATLNTNLSISIPARPLVTNDEEKSPASSSDATISDTTITAYENANLCS